MSANKSALDEILGSEDYTPDIRQWSKLYRAARAELAQLRATVAGQARQLEEARPFAEYVRDNEMSTEQIYVNAKSWLAANPAPAPQAAQRRE